MTSLSTSAHLRPAPSVTSRRTWRSASRPAGPAVAAVAVARCMAVDCAAEQSWRHVPRAFSSRSSTSGGAVAGGEGGAATGARCGVFVHDAPLRDGHGCGCGCGRSCAAVGESRWSSQLLVQPCSSSPFHAAAAAARRASGLVAAAGTAAASGAAAAAEATSEGVQQQEAAGFDLENERNEMQRIDDELSRRPLDLDPAGYFIVFVDRGRREIVAQHFRNVINERGLACDPETGEVIPCDGSYKPKPTHEFRGKTAKQVSVAVVERWHGNGNGIGNGNGSAEGKQQAPIVTMLSHANYLGRELQKAETALTNGCEYVQD